MVGNELLNMIAFMVWLLFVWTNYIEHFCDNLQWWKMVINYISSYLVILIIQPLANNIFISLVTCSRIFYTKKEIQKLKEVPTFLKLIISSHGFCAKRHIIKYFKRWKLVLDFYKLRKKLAKGNLHFMYNLRRYFHSWFMKNLTLVNNMNIWKSWKFNSMRECDSWKCFLFFSVWLQKLWGLK